MADPKGADGDELAPFVIQNIEFDDQAEEAGHGAYGVIHNVTLNGLPYIAKRLHNALVKHDNKRETDSMKEEFRKECVTLSHLRHPNIVHFGGVHYGGQDRSDITLIMERLRWDLSEFLTAHSQLALPLKISILLDVTYGLLYLHTHDPPIVHRDLTARNVLVALDGSAKIGDLGVAKLLTPQARLALKHTKAPGQPLYMPPEALQEEPECTPKIDIFSFGHLSLYVINEEEPDVFEVQSTKEVQAIEPGTIQAFKRRTALDKVRQDHCMYPLILCCLHDDPAGRPITVDLNGRVKELSIKNSKKKAITEHERQHLEKRVTELQSIVTTLNAEKEGLSELVSKAVEDSQATAIKLATTVGEMRSEIDGLKKEKADSVDELEAHKFMAATFREDFISERRDREEAHSKIALMETQFHQQLQSLKEETSDEIQSWKKQVELLKKQNETLEIKDEELCRMVEDFHQENVNIKAKKRTLATEGDLVSVEVLHNERAKREELEKRLFNLKKCYDDLILQNEMLAKKSLQEEHPPSSSSSYNNQVQSGGLSTASGHVQNPVLLPSYPNIATPMASPSSHSLPRRSRAMSVDDPRILNPPAADNSESRSRTPLLSVHNLDSTAFTYSCSDNGARQYHPTNTAGHVHSYSTGSSQHSVADSTQAVPCTRAYEQPVTNPQHPGGAYTQGNHSGSIATCRDVSLYGTPTHSSEHAQHYQNVPRPDDRRNSLSCVSPPTHSSDRAQFSQGSEHAHYYQNLPLHALDSPSQSRRSFLRSYSDTPERYSQPYQHGGDSVILQDKQNMYRPLVVGCKQSEHSSGGGDTERGVPGDEVSPPHNESLTYGGPASVESSGPSSVNPQAVLRSFQWANQQHQPVHQLEPDTAFPHSHQPLQGEGQQGGDGGASGVTCTDTVQPNTLNYPSLESGIDNEIQVATNIKQQAEGHNSIEGSHSNAEAPLDPNLICPTCKLQFRIGEIQSYRKHFTSCAKKE